MGIMELLAGIPVNANLRIKIERLDRERIDALDKVAELEKRLEVSEAAVLELRQQVERLEQSPSAEEREQQRLRTLGYDPTGNL